MSAGYLDLANDAGIIVLAVNLVTKADEVDPADPELHRSGGGVR